MTAKPDNRERVKRWKAIREARIKTRKPWDELAAHVVRNLLPGYGQFLKFEQQRGKQEPGRYEHIVDNTGTQALRLATAGLQSGLTSPARSWFSYGSVDPEMSKWGPFREWFQTCEKVTLAALGYTNFYPNRRRVYEGQLGFGSVCTVVEEDFRSVVRYTTLSYGEFWVGMGHDGEASDLYRDLWLTPEQLISKFGPKNVSKNVKKAYDEHSQDLVQVHHVIERNPYRDPQMLDNRNMEWISVYFEASPNADGDLLRDSGYANRPFVLDLWDPAGNNPYGEAQSFMILGQLGLLREMNLGQIKGMHYQVEPPVVAPESWKNKRINRLPGAINFVDTSQGGHAYGPLYQINPDISAVSVGIKDRQEMIRRGFFNDLLFMSAPGGPAKTATESAQLYQEQILMLSPQIERQFESLDKILDITLEIMAARSLLPEAPPELQGQMIKVEYTSRLAQVQKLSRTAPIEQTYGFFKQLAEAEPEVLDNFDFDDAAREYADLTGSPVTIIRDPQKVEARRQQRADDQAQSQAHQAELEKLAAIKQLGDTKLGQGNMLDQMVGGQEAGA